MAEWVESFEEYAQKLLSQAKITGAAVGLAKQGQMDYFRGFGLADDTEDALELTPDTVFGIGSVTKSFTCVAIMQLQEQGKLHVHDPVRKYIPELSTPNENYTRAMTIHHLMTHTAGFPPLDSLVGAMKNSMLEDTANRTFSSGLQWDLDKAEAIETYDELLAYMAKLEYELLGAPGEHFSYSNDSYALLGIIVGRVSGIAYEQFVREHILEPAGMTNSAFLIEELPADAQVATLFTRKSPEEGGAVFRSPAWWDAPAMRSGGFLKSTIRDLLRYTELFRTGGLVGDKRLLSADSVKDMTTPYAPLTPFQSYGYGLMIGKDCHGGTLIEHGGAIKGVSAQIFTIPESDTTGAILMNVDGGPATDLMHGLLNEYRGQPAATPPFPYADYELPVERLATYVGEYRSSEGANVTVEIEENGLVLKAMGGKLPLRAVGEDGFVFKRGETDSYIRFFRDEAGEISRMGFGFRQLPKVSVGKEQTV